MRNIKIWNQGLSFLVEIAMLLALGYWGFHKFHGVTGWMVGVGIPLLTIIIWSIWAAPKSNKRLKQPHLVALKAVLFVLAGIALLLVSKTAWAIIFLVAAAINQLLEYYFDTRKP